MVPPQGLAFLWSFPPNDRTFVEATAGALQPHLWRQAAQRPWWPSFPSQSLSCHRLLEGWSATHQSQLGWGVLQLSGGSASGL